jgi:hypothetical protein
VTGETKAFHITHGQTRKEVERGGNKWKNNGLRQFPVNSGWRAGRSSEFGMQRAECKAKHI